jgi:hypothetical protein
LAFFDQYDIFLQTSRVGNWPERLNSRHRAIIEDNVVALSGARVLDLASHDGRWSFAALKAGAAHVTGIEVRPELAEAAKLNMQDLSVPAETYRFIAADAFEQRDIFHQTFDVILCLGFLYHTTRHVELIELMARTGARTMIIDTRVTNSADCMTVLTSERSDHPANGFDDTGTRNGRILVGYPTPPAMALMLGHFGYDLRRFDWRGYIAEGGFEADPSKPQSARNPLGDYAAGLRETFTATLKSPR